MTRDARLASVMAGGSLLIALTTAHVSSAQAEDYYFKLGDAKCTMYDSKKTPSWERRRLVFYPSLDECETVRAQTPVPPIKLPDLGPGKWMAIGKLTNAVGGQHVVIVKPPLKAENDRYVIWIALNTMVAIPAREKEAVAKANNLDQWDREYPGAKFTPMLYFIDCENMSGSIINNSITPYVSIDDYQRMTARAEVETQHIIDTVDFMEDIEQKLMQSGRLSYIQRSTVPALVARVICH